MTFRRMSLAAGLGLTLVAAACQNDELFTPLTPAYPGGAMFVRYVAMGNSITAGFQSGGINDTSQLQSYVRLVANAMGTAYYYPQLVFPGCPPPFTNIFTNTRVAGGTATTCYLRSSNIPPFLTNVAVPQAEVLDILQNGPAPGTNSNALTQLMLGGCTQIQAMMDARPSFVSVWIGNNDLLGAAMAGDTTLATDTTIFKSRYAEVLDSIESGGAKALLIGVGLGNLGLGTVLPFFSRGSTYYGLWAGGAFNTSAPFFSVDANCAPPRGDTVLVSFPYGFGLLAAGATTTTVLDCTAAPVIEPPEVLFFVQLQIAYNTFIQDEAATRSWAYMDLNAAFDSVAGVAGNFAPFPNSSAACSASPFGLAFSCDGIHPSAASHRLIAKKVVQAINAEYLSAIPAVP